MNSRGSSVSGPHQEKPLCSLCLCGESLSEFAADGQPAGEVLGQLHVQLLIGRDPHVVYLLLHAPLSDFLAEAVDFGEVRRGLLGVTIQTIDSESAEALGSEVDSGALVSAIEPGSAAEDAGLLVDDIIVKVGEKKIDNSRELATAIGLKGSGDTIDIEFVRNGRHRKVQATLGQQSISEIAGADMHAGLTGAMFASTSTTTSGGINVTDVEPGSPAAQRGLRAGDTIIQVNRRPVQNIQQLQDIAEDNRILFLLVQRGDRALMLQIR